MTLLVCPLSQVETARALHRPSHLISLLSPTDDEGYGPRRAPATRTCVWPSTTSRGSAKA